MNGNGYCIHLLIQWNIIEKQEISLTLGDLRELKVEKLERYKIGFSKLHI